MKLGRDVSRHDELDKWCNTYRYKSVMAIIWLFWTISETDPGLWDRLKDENFEALSCEAIYGFEGADGRTDIVLDGQQRLTAMYYAFMAPDKPAPRNRAGKSRLGRGIWAVKPT